MTNSGMRSRRCPLKGPAPATVVLALNILLVPFAAEITLADTLRFNPSDGWANADVMGTERGLSSVAQLTGDSATFVSDVTIEDGTVMNPGQSFTKTWRFRNTGSTGWSSYSMVFVGGDQMGAPASVPVPTTAPGAIVDISVPMIATTEPGPHTGNWLIRTAGGRALGGSDVFVLIMVKGTRTLAELETDLRDHSPHVRQKAVEALTGFGPQAAPTLTRVLKNDADAQVRSLAMAALAGIKPLSTEAFQGILAALNDPDGTVRYIAAEVLYSIGPKLGPGVVPTLVRTLTDPNPTAQSMAIQLLGALGPAAKEAIPALRELVTRQPNNDSAKAALRVIEGH